MDKTNSDADLEGFFDQTLDILAIGLEGFATELSSQGVQVTALDWKPPANADPELAQLLSKLGV